MHDALQREVEDRSVEGWQLHEEHSDDKVTLIKRKYGTLGGHTLVALLTAWWTLGIGNALYAAYKYFLDADKKVLRYPGDVSVSATTSGTTTVSDLDAEADAEADD